MGHIFISYKREEDSDFADVLINRLQGEGFTTWVDNDRINAGEDWRNTIDQAIKEAFALIVIMSPEAKASEYVTYEWAFAWGAGVKVIPVLFKQTELHPRLAALQYLDFTSRTSRPWDRLFNVLRNAAVVSAVPFKVKVRFPPNQNPFEIDFDPDNCCLEIRDLEGRIKLTRPPNLLLGGDIWYFTLPVDMTPGDSVRLELVEKNGRKWKILPFAFDPHETLVEAHPKQEKEGDNHEIQIR